jgi:signal transduction histidine kinase
MLISLAFSLALYNVSTKELTILQKRQEDFMHNTLNSLTFVVPSGFTEFNEERLKQIEQSKRNIAIKIGYFNLVIFVASAGLGYFLARRTLNPIEEAVKAQNRFTADASHELRTPLTVMRAELEVALLEKSFRLADSKKLHQSTLEEIAKLEALTTGLLKLSQNDESGSHTFQICSLDTIIKEAVERVTAVAKQREIRIELEVKDRKIQGDQWALTELVSILLDNAIKYSHQGATIKVRVSSERHHHLITVQDEGIGIKASEIPYIFNRFYRADVSRSKEKVEGYGLGLSIAKKIVEAHQGTIEVESEPGKGSRFVIKLPSTIKST